MKQACFTIGGLMHYNYEYFKRTSMLDMQENYNFFAQYFHGKTILDLGCGSGRDSNYFKKKNYHVTSVDNSECAKKFALQEYGISVDLIDIEEGISGVFDGIWACASLVHMNSTQVSKILSKLKTNLKDGGLIYISLKYGYGVHEKNNQIYYLYNENFLSKLNELGYEVLNHKISLSDNPMNNWLELILQQK